VSLRLKLLLLGLATFVLPWAGCQYVREMESVLRRGEEQALQAMAKAVAASLQGREELLYRGGVGPGALSPFDLQPLPLSGAPFLDGYADDWPDRPDAWRSFSRGDDRLRVLMGVHERMLFVLLDVKDARLVFDAPGGGFLDPQSFGDRIWLGFTDTYGFERQVFLALLGPGPVRARRIEELEFGRREVVDEPRIEGAWQPTNEGYRVELRVPLSMVGERFGVLIDDRDERGAEPESFGSLAPENLATRGRLVAAAPGLDDYLRQFSAPGLRLMVTTPEGAPLATVDRLAVPTDPNPDRGLLARLYRRILDRPGERRRVELSVPIQDHDRQRTIGVLHVAQSADRWLTLRDDAVTRLLNFTLITSILAVLAIFAFAIRLAFRLARLRRASESALTREGLVTDFPETESPDELGDVARSFSTLLARLNDYTGYLRTLAGKLAHEIRTPLTIVRSSLENLEAETLPEQARPYVARAREGSERLNAILVAMGAASRVEEAIRSAERSRFDLVPLLDSAVESYRMAFPQREFRTELPRGPVVIEGAPDLIVQMLDKLVDNAVDFSPHGSVITVRLLELPEEAVLEVDNPGPTLPPGLRERMFESLWQSRTGSDSRPHFGLGLYIVRLIAEFHGGRAEADNLPHDSGARFRVRLARGRREDAT